MRREYSDPPLVEAVCDLHFVPLEPWDWTIAGLLYARLKETYPKRRQRNVVQFKFSSSEGGAQQSGTVDRIQFLDESEKSLIQISPNLLAVNSLKPYLGWDRFRSRILEAVHAYVEVANPKAAAGIVLRYINRIDLPMAELELTDYFALSLPKPSGLDADIGSFATQVDFVAKDKNAVLRVAFATVEDDQPTESSFLLDISARAVEAVTVEALKSWLESAHTLIEDTFERSVTGKLRNELFGEAK